MMDKIKNMAKAAVPPKPATAKEARLKAALKANMGRRKAQARARADADDTENNKNE